MHPGVTGFAVNCGAGNSSPLLVSVIKNRAGAMPPRTAQTGAVRPLEMPMPMGKKTPVSLGMVDDDTFKGASFADIDEVFSSA